MPSVNPTGKPEEIPSRRSLAEVGLVHVRIEYVQPMYDGLTDGHRMALDNLVKTYLCNVVEFLGGKVFSWHGTFAVFEFRLAGRVSCDTCCKAAMHLLKLVPSLNVDLQKSTNLDKSLDFCICCDTGLVAYDPNPSKICDDFINRFLNCQYKFGTAGSLTVTDRFYQMLGEHRDRFGNWKNSAELQTKLHLMKSAPNAAAAPASSPPTLPPVGGMNMTAPPNPPPPPESETGHGKPRSGRPAKKKTRITAILGSVAVLFAAIAVIEGIVLFLGKRQEMSSGESLRMPAATISSQKLFPTEEWIKWLKLANEKLTPATANEQDLIEVVNKKPKLTSDVPAANLRGDQAIADVLLSYTNIAAIFAKNFGIYPDFLGTGLAEPVHQPGYANYGSEMLHEYLIPNLPANNDRVWTRSFRGEILDQEETFGALIKSLVEKSSQPFLEDSGLNTNIIKFAETPRGNKETPQAVIRFALFSKAKYKNTLGRPEARRVFACDLSEVWNLKIKEAADLSGYSFSTDPDVTFYIWIYHPLRDGHDAVLATWHNVFAYLPEWLPNADNKIN